MSLRNNNAFRPTLDRLDERIQPSWTSVPPPTVDLHAQGDYHYNLGGFSPTGFSTTSLFTGHEVDYRTFVAPRTGYYQFSAGASGSNVDTVAALYSASGQRLAFNDDSNGSRDSSFGAQLSAGQTYAFGVTTFGRNIDPVVTGGYRASITLPNLFATRYSGDFKTYADVNVTGTTLNIHLFGHSTGVFDRDTHRVEVRLMDRFGQPIHTGAWVRELNTAGDFIPGTPTSTDQRWSINVAGFDLGRVAYIDLRVSHH